MKIALIGYGKMGHMIEEIALSRGHEIVCRIEPTPALPKGKEIYSPQEGFESEAFRRADVAIEFTTPATAKDNILRAWAQGVPVVSGSTGWKPEELKIKNYELRIKDNKTIITDETGKTMLVWSSNFSVGVNIFFELNKWLAEKMAENSALSRGAANKEGANKEGGYTPSIKEIHHIHKFDKPSGTAKTLCEQIETSRFRDVEISKREEIEITSIREGEVPGTHEVKWDSEEDTIIITHIAKGRRGFALGAVLAAEEICDI